MADFRSKVFIAAGKVNRGHYLHMLRYKLRSLLIVLAVGPWLTTPRLVEIHDYDEFWNLNVDDDKSRMP